MGMTQQISKGVDGVTQDVSNKLTESTQDLSDTAEEKLQETSDFVKDQIINAAEAMSVFHGIAQSIQNSDDMDAEKDKGKDDSVEYKIQDERFAKYGDPAAEINKKAQEREKEPENPYDYPRALRKYL